MTDWCKWTIIKPSREKTNIIDSALSIDPDQPKHAAQANPDRHLSPPADVLYQESLFFTALSLGRNVSARISLLGLRRLIWVDASRRSHNVGFLAGRFILIRKCAVGYTSLRYKTVRSRHSTDIPFVCWYLIILDKGRSHSFFRIASMVFNVFRDGNGFLVSTTAATSLHFPLSTDGFTQVHEIEKVL